MSHAALSSIGLERRRTACAGLLLCTCLAWTSAWADDQLARGKRLYEERCGACHSLDEHGAGPKHRGLVGRKTGTQAGFEYSAALAASKIVWSPQTLERWIADPNGLIPGNRMIVQLANDPDERAAIVAYLVDSSRGPRCATTLPKKSDLDRTRVHRGIFSAAPPDVVDKPTIEQSRRVSRRP